METGNQDLSKSVQDYLLGTAHRQCPLSKQSTVRYTCHICICRYLCAATGNCLDLHRRSKMLVLYIYVVSKVPTGSDRVGGINIGLTK